MSIKATSQRTWELLRQLYQRQSFLERLVKPDPFPLWVFDEIAASGEAEAVSQIASFLLHDDAEVCAAAARAIGQLIRQVDAADYPHLDGACRDSCDYNYSEGGTSKWKNLKPSHLKAFQHLPHRPVLAGVASFHRSGYVRQAAVRELADTFDGTELPFLLLRLNDWVGEVRDAAASSVLLRVEPRYAPHFFRYLRLLLRLRPCGRAEHDHIIEAVLKLLRQPSATDLLAHGLRSGDRVLRRESIQILAGTDTAEHASLLKEMMGDRDPIMRLWIARTLVTKLSPADLRGVITTLLQDRFHPVRSLALNLLAEQFRAESRGPLLVALCDRHASIRALSRYWLRKIDPQFDFAAEYRKKVRPESVSQAGAISGLGETGSPVDAQPIFPFLNSPTIGIRKAAIVAIATLDGDRFVGQLIAAVADEHPGVSKQAAAALRSRAKSLGDELQPLFKSETRRHVRKNLFKLLAAQTFWSRGIFLFSTLRDTDADIVGMGQYGLQDWLKKSGNMAMGPTPPELRELHNAFKESSGMLSKRAVQEFDLLLRSYK